MRNQPENETLEIFGACLMMFLFLAMAAMA